MYYKVPVKISRQGDGLWRVEALHLKGCWVDASTLDEALAQINEVIVMVLDIYEENQWPLPSEVTTDDALPMYTYIPVVTSETKLRTSSKSSTTSQRHR